MIAKKDPTGTPVHWGHSVLVWDLPTRLFHWILVVCVAVSVVTGNIGGLYMRYHEWSGVAILVLVFFRVVWGVFGGRYVRFTAFVAGPGEVAAYARKLFDRDGERHLGHNPLGGWAILAMLAILGTQAGTGLFATDDILTEGPLVHWVGDGLSDLLTRIHHLNKLMLIGLVVVHLSAVTFYYLVKGDNLLVPMLTGYKRWPHSAANAENGLFKALGIMAALSLAVYLVIY